MPPLTEAGATYRPIVFSGPMVLAIFARLKSVTRRISLPCARCQNVGEIHRQTRKGLTIVPCPRCHGIDLCPLGVPGDLLWVRETYEIGPAWVDAERVVGDEGFLYKATWEKTHLGPWRSPRFMPRRASRLTLRITDTRREKLHAITDADVALEGVSPSTREEFSRRWDALHAKREKPHPWASNPDVWRIAFEVMA